MADSEKVECSLEAAQKAVEDLYEYRDHYIANYGIECAGKKVDDVKKKMEETLEFVDKCKESVHSKAMYHFLRGRTLNVQSTHDPQALDDLCKAVKLDPKMAPAWNDLGECYWKSGDIANAKNCFTGALDYSRNKVSLRNLSMVMRQLSGGSQHEVRKLTEESVAIAKEAVQQDIHDGTSWLILGNAYLKLFFAQNQNPTTLQQCLKAYKQAEKYPVSKGNPDLFYNRGMCHQFQEDYEAALKDMDMAAQLDPTWELPTTTEQALLAYLTRVSELTQTKGKVKPKKLDSMLESLNEQRDLGPYAEGTFKGAKEQTIKLRLVPFRELRPKVNHERTVLGKVVCNLTMDKTVPFTFCMVDREQTCMPVSVYNLAPGCGVKIGDSVAIPDPNVQVIEVDHKNQKFSMRMIRVDRPIQLVVNGRKFTQDKEIPMVMTVSAMSD